MFGNQPIIQTRIIPPRRRKNVVERNRLLFLLNEQIEKRLVLVTAPAGYGKTSLLVNFVYQSNLPVCWYSIDRLDFDPLRFITYLAAAIKQKYPKFGKRTEAVVAGEQRKFDPDYVATVMINDIYDHINEHFLIVLDDYHLVNDSLEIRSFMSRLMMDLDENCHFLISSRSLLSLPDLPMLVARSEVGGVSYEELEFVPEEIQEFYRKNQKVVISLEDAKQIQERTEGWVTGIVLTGQVTEKDVYEKMRINRVLGFSIDDYFSEIINQLPDDLRSFLLWTSLLEEFDETSCEAILSPVVSVKILRWDEWINAILQRNLFVVPVGEKGEYLRYHALFLEYLQRRMQEEQPELSIEIRKQFARSLVDKGEIDQAFVLYRNLNSLDDQVEIIQEFGLDMILNGRVSTVSGWLDSLPVEVLNSQPYIVALQGNIAMVTGDTRLALTLFDQAIDQMDENEECLHLINTLLMRSAANRIIGKLEEARSDANKIIQLVENYNINIKKKAEALRVIGLCDFHQGKLKNALKNLEASLQIMTSIQDRKNIAVIHLEIGMINEHLGNYFLTKQNYQLAINYWKKLENSYWLSNLYNNLGVLNQLLGEYKDASHSYHQALNYARSCGYSRMEAYILTGMGDVYSELHDDEGALHIYSMAEEISEKTQEIFLQIYLQIQRASIFGFQKEYSKARKILSLARENINQDSNQMERNLIDLEIEVLKIQEDSEFDSFSSLETICEFFESGGHKNQFDKANFYLMVGYVKSKQHEKVIEKFLHLYSSLQSEYPPATLVAIASRIRNDLRAYSPTYLHNEYQFFLESIDKFTRNLPSLRREVRKTSSNLQISEPTIKIRSLGRMEVSLDNHLVSNSEWQTQAAKELFFLILAHPEGLTKEEISFIFWPDASYEESKFRFKNTIYRMRRAIGKECVLLDQNVYRFNNKINYEYDVEQFLKQNALANQKNDPVNKLSHYREALKYYRGDYLSEIDFTWVMSPREFLRQIHLDMLLQISSIYFNQSNLDLALDYCQRALAEDNLLEDAHRLAMKIYAAMGNRAALVQQYQKCVEVLEKEINTKPSSQTLELFQNLLK